MRKISRSNSAIPHFKGDLNKRKSRLNQASFIARSFNLSKRQYREKLFLEIDDLRSLLYSGLVSFIIRD